MYRKLFLLAGCFAAALLGCSSGPDEPTIYKFSGQAMHKGEPLANATVVFSPADGGRPSYGKVDETGQFTMYYKEGMEGVTAGENTVSLQPPAPAPDAPPMSPTQEKLFDKYAEGQSPMKITVEKDTIEQLMFE